MWALHAGITSPGPHLMTSSSFLYLDSSSSGDCIYHGLHLGSSARGTESTPEGGGLSSVGLSVWFSNGALSGRHSLGQCRSQLMATRSGSVPGFSMS